MLASSIYIINSGIVLWRLPPRAPRHPKSRQVLSQARLLPRSSCCHVSPWCHVSALLPRVTSAGAVPVSPPCLRYAPSSASAIQMFRHGFHARLIYSFKLSVQSNGLLLSYQVFLCALLPGTRELQALGLRVQVVGPEGAPCWARSRSGAKSHAAVSEWCLLLLLWVLYTGCSDVPRPRVCHQALVQRYSDGALILRGMLLLSLSFPGVCPQPFSGAVPCTASHVPPGFSPNKRRLRSHCPVLQEPPPSLSQQPPFYSFWHGSHLGLPTQSADCPPGFVPSKRGLGAEGSQVGPQVP